jgi:hypothetical protein
MQEVALTLPTGVAGGCRTERSTRYEAERRTNLSVDIQTARHPPAIPGAAARERRDHRPAVLG